MLELTTYGEALRVIEDRALGRDLCPVAPSDRRPDEGRAIRARTLEVQELDAGAVEPRAAHVSVFRIEDEALDPAEIGIAQARPVEPGLTQLTATEIGAVEPRAQEAHPLEVHTREIRAAEIDEREQPFHGSWLNQVEIWFSILTSKCLRGRPFNGVHELAAAIRRFTDHWNREMAHPFHWTYSGKVLHA